MHKVLDRRWTKLGGQKGAGLYIYRSLREYYMSKTIVHGVKKEVSGFLCILGGCWRGNLEDEQTTADDGQKDSASSSEETGSETSGTSAATSAGGRAGRGVCET